MLIGWAWRGIVSAGQSDEALDFGRCSANRSGTALTGSDRSLRALGADNPVRTAHDVGAGL